MLRTFRISNIRVAFSKPACAAIDEIILHVRAIGLNFRDVLNVLGEYPGDVPCCARLRVPRLALPNSFTVHWRTCPCSRASSFHPLLGAVGQANYSAMNSILDTLAVQRRARAQHASSVQWGPWGEIGMASKTEIARMAHARLRSDQQRARARCASSCGAAELSRGLGRLASELEHLTAASAIRCSGVCERWSHHAAY